MSTHTTCSAPPFLNISPHFNEWQDATTTNSKSDGYLERISFSYFSNKNHDIPLYYSSNTSISPFSLIELIYLTEAPLNDSLLFSSPWPEKCNPIALYLRLSIRFCNVASWYLYLILNPSWPSPSIMFWNSSLKLISVSISSSYRPSISINRGEANRYAKWI